MRTTLSVWRRTWRGIDSLRQSCTFESIKEFDEHFGGSWSVRTWIQDFLPALYEAACDEEPVWRELADVCETVSTWATNAQKDSGILEFAEGYLQKCRDRLSERTGDNVPRDVVAVPGEPGEEELDRIISALDRPIGEDLPEQALRNAQRCPAAITPRLARLIESATARVQAGEPVETVGHFLALFLLTEFRATEAWPAIRAAISLPDDGPFELFGDAVIDTLGRMLAVFPHASDDLDALIANRALSTIVRWQAARAYLHWVRDGHIQRLEAVQRLGQHLRDVIETPDDGEFAAELICELEHYSPREVIGDIREC